MFSHFSFFQTLAIKTDLAFTFGDKALGLEIIYRVMDLSKKTKTTDIDRKSELIDSFTPLLSYSLKRSSYEYLKNEDKEIVKNDIAAGLSRVSAFWPQVGKRYIYKGLGYHYSKKGEEESVSFPYPFYLIDNQGYPALDQYYASVCKGYDLIINPQYNFYSCRNNRDFKDTPYLVKSSNGKYVVYGYKNNTWRLTEMETNFCIPDEWKNNTKTNAKVFVESGSDIYYQLRKGHDYVFTTDDLVDAIEESIENCYPIKFENTFRKITSFSFFCEKNSIPHDIVTEVQKQLVEQTFLPCK